MDIAHLTGRDVLEVAVQIEKNGVRFYTLAGETVRNERLSELLSFLAEEEKRHITTFEEMLNDIPADAPPGTTDPYLDEASLYIGALADSKVFTKHGIGLRLDEGVKNESEILRLAIDMEKDSILFYHELKNGVREGDRPSVEKLISEEKEHFVKLQKLQRELIKG